MRGESVLNQPIDLRQEDNTPKLYKNKNFILLAQGQIVSNIGNSIHNIAVTWFIISSVAMSHSGLMLALFSACCIIPSILLSPFSGVLVDRVSRKLIIVGADIMNGILLLNLALFSYYEIFPLPMLFITTIFCSLMGTLFYPAVGATIPNIVHSENLIKANSFSGMSNQISILVGATVAGFLYAKVGIIGVFLINGVSFILSGISEIFIAIPKITKNRASSNKKSHFFRELKEGFRYISKNKALRILLIFALFLNFTSTPFLSILIPKTIKYSLNLNASYLGIINSMLSFGMITGMVCILLIGKRKINYYRLLILGLIFQSVLTIFFAIPIFPHIKAYFFVNKIFIILCSLIFIYMLCSSFINIPINTVFQKSVPDEYRGRFFALFSTGCMAMVPLGNGIIGYLSGHISTNILILSLGILQLTVCIILVFFPIVKELYNNL